MHLLDQNDEDDVPEEYVPLWRRPGSSVEETREEAFQAYINAPNPYFDAIAAAGGTPWHNHDIEARRALFYRRYIKTNDRVAL